jgi:hypothetical protein
MNSPVLIQNKLGCILTDRFPVQALTLYVLKETLRLTVTQEFVTICPVPKI